MVHKNEFDNRNFNNYCNDLKYDSDSSVFSVEIKQKSDELHRNKSIFYNNNDSKNMVIKTIR